MLDTLIRKLGYIKPSDIPPSEYFYYACKGKKEVYEALERIYASGEKYRRYTLENAKQQVIFTSLGDKDMMYFYRYSVKKTGAKKPTIEWCPISSGEPMYCGERISMTPPKKKRTLRKKN